MSTFITSLEKVILPFAIRIGRQQHVNAIKNGFIRLMPLTLTGAMFVLINNVFLSFGEGSFFFSMGVRLDGDTITMLNGWKAIGGNVYNGTLGIMSLMTPFFISMALAEEKKVDPLSAALLAIAAFMTVTPFSVGEAYAVGANWLGGPISSRVSSSVWWWLKYSLSLSDVIGLSVCQIVYPLRFPVLSRH
ncbi:phosphotransferase system, EIIC family protein [Yersinia pestis 8787]|nr:phosphotransferase system, EIIC family protein [Yersinia pestis 8787]